MNQVEFILVLIASVAVGFILYEFRQRLIVPVLFVVLAAVFAMSLPKADNKQPKEQVIQTRGPTLYDT
nr:MAG TPA: hypothetical protein [Caudoviricetes sp.]